MATSAKNPFAVITGASSGIGLELAREFVRNGYDVLIAAEDVGIERARSELSGQGPQVEALKVDLATPGGVKALKTRLGSRPVDALCVNAGIGVGGAFVDNDLSAELSLIRLNIVSAVHLTKLILRDMVARGEGCILFTSSIAATAPGPYYATYAASKAFLQSFAMALRAEVADSGITITALMPGATDTAFFERAHMETTKAGAGPKDDPAEVARQGFAALMAGKDHVVAGSLGNKLQALATKVLPETLTAAMQGRETRPGSAPH